MRKYIALILCFFVVIPLIGCSRQKIREDEYIVEGTPWFSSEYYEIEDHRTVSSEYCFPILFTPDIKLFSQTKDMDSNEMCNRIMYFADKSAIPSYINIDSYLSKDASYNYICCACECESVTYVVMYEYNQGEDYYTLWEIDTENGCLINPVSIIFDNEYENSVTISAVKKSKDLICIEFYYFDSNYVTRNGFRIITVDGEPISEFLLKDEIVNFSFDNDFNIYCITNDRTKSYSDVALGCNILDVDYRTGEFDILEISNEIKNKYFRSDMFNDEYIYVKDYNNLSITRYNLQLQEEEVYLDFNFCDANISDLSRLNYWCYDDCVIFADGMWLMSEEQDYSTIIECKRETTNPHVGDVVIIAAAPYGIDYIEAEGIRNFNSSSEKYYCYLTTEYYVSHFIPANFDNDDYYQEIYNVELSMLSTLQQNIIAGTGPDILLNFGEYSLMNSSEYLVNLLPTLDGKDGINRDEYFSNFFDAYTFNDKLFQIPLSAYAVGIYTNKIEDTSKEGFTFEDYRIFVEEECNNFDPISEWNDRNAYFELLSKYCNDDYYDEKGNLLLDEDMFSRYCEYINLVEIEAHYTMGSTSLQDFSSIFSNLYDMRIFENRTLYGLPGSTEKGVAAYIPESVAITTCSGVKDEAWGIVKSLLSYDSQKTHKNYNPIQKAAFDDFGDRAVEKANREIQSLYGFNDYYDVSIVAHYKACLEKATVPMLSDTITLSIMNEELQPYFAGKKSIEDVIPVIESRVNTMLEERR